MNEPRSSTLTNQVKSVMNKTKNIGQKVMNTTTKLKNDIKNKVDKASNITTKPLWLQNGKSYLDSFIETNTAFSKFVFIVLILLAFIFLFQVGMIILTKFINGYSGDVYIIKGMCNANQERIISNNPNIENSATILRSVNEYDGIEFTWSVWTYINSLPSVTGTDTNYYKIFSKGETLNNTVLNSNLSSSSLPYSKIINNSPGMYLTTYIPDNFTTVSNSVNNFIDLNSTTNTNYSNLKGTISLVVVLNIFHPENQNGSFAELITVNSIPIQKWFNCTLTLKNKTARIYINGELNKQLDLSNVPTQNNYDTYVGQSNGFNGYISNLRYFSRAISYEEVRSINEYGPNLINIDTVSGNNTDYLSMSWYYNN